MCEHTVLFFIADVGFLIHAALFPCILYGALNMMDILTFQKTRGFWMHLYFKYLHLSAYSSISNLYSWNASRTFHVSGHNKKLQRDYGLHGLHLAGTKPFHHLWLLWEAQGIYRSSGNRVVSRTYHLKHSVKYCDGENVPEQALGNLFQDP